MNRQLVWAVCVVSLLGCSTPYRPLSGRFGYDDFRISADVFEISFAGNGHTPPSVVNRYVLRRASEVTLANGFTHFVVISEKDESLYGAAGTTSGYGSASTYNGGQHATGNYSGNSLQVPFRFPAGRIRIQCTREPNANHAICARDFLSYNYPDAILQHEPGSTDHGAPLSRAVSEK